MPPDSIILVTGFALDGTMRDITETQFVSIIAPVSPATIWRRTAGDANRRFCDHIGRNRVSSNGFVP
jgi:hypothetical protein